MHKTTRQDSISGPPAKRSRLPSKETLSIDALNARVEQIARSFPDTPFQNVFRFIPKSASGPCFLARTIAGNKEICLIQEKIGEGSFSIIYKVHILGSNRILALKVRKNDEDSVLNIKNECQIRSALSLSEGERGPHSYMYGIVYTPPSMGKPKKIMGFLDELYEGNYKELITRQIDRPLDFTQIGKEFTDIADSISNLHKKGYAHRDIKSENFLYKDGSIHLADFGNAKALNQIEDIDDCDTVLPIAYTLPEDEDELLSLSNELYDLTEHGNASQASKIELLENQIKALHKSIDVFAMGTIFYERCYFGSRPYPDPEQDVPLAFDEKTKEPLPIQEHSGRTLPPGLKELIHQTISHRYRDRPTASEVVARLKEAFTRRAVISGNLKG